jgi:hypothetical protein
MDINKLNRMFSTVRDTASLDEAIRVFAAAKDPNWRLAVHLSGGGIAILTARELEIALRRLGKAGLRHTTLQDLQDLLKAETSVDKNIYTQFSQGELDFMLNRSERRKLVVTMENGDLLGLFEPQERGDAFSAATEYILSQLGQSAKPPDRGIPLAPESPQPPQPPTPSPRHTNTCLVDTSENRSVVAKQASLEPGTEYALRVDIGVRSEDSIIDNPSPFPDEKLPPSETGHWLEVVTVSDDFTIPEPRHFLFLPRTGASWVCSCPPGSQFHLPGCEHQDYLYIPLTAPNKSGEATIRLGIYFANNLVESQLLTAHVGDPGQPGSGLRSHIDYSLNASLADISFLPPRTLNILTNQNTDGTHRLLIHGVPDREFHFQLTEGQMRKAIDDTRQGLRNVHFRVYGGQWGSKPQEENLLDENNAKPVDKFIEDIRQLAPVGFRLWSVLFTNQPAWGKELRLKLLAHSATIQVSRTQGSQFVYPWGLVYDIPLDSDLASHTPCRLLKQWDQYKDQVAQGLSECPFEAEHVLNTLCPYGFWGFKHAIEQPPKPPDDSRLKLSIDPGQDPVHMVMGLSTTLDGKLTTAHIQELQKELSGFTIDDYDSCQKIHQALGDNALELIYFYCHGRHTVVTQAGGDIIEDTFLEIGKSDHLNADDLIAWNQAGWDPEKHWHEISPLVFINGCHTTDMTPETLISFVDAFVGVYAAGVIGTEITIHQKLANEVAENFFAEFKAHKGVGEAIKRMRQSLLAKGNLLGLAYTPYCSVDLKLL